MSPRLFQCVIYTNCVSLKLICASLNVELCIIKIHFKNLGSLFSGKLSKLLPLDVKFKAKMHQNDFGWGSMPNPAVGAYSAPPHPLTGIKGTYF